MRLPNPLLLPRSTAFRALPRFTRRCGRKAFPRPPLLILLWTVIIVSLWIGIQMVWLSERNPPISGRISFRLCLISGWPGLRWYSIGYLGRYFTVDVSISTEHKLIDSGPYRHIRHPPTRRFWPLSAWDFVLGIRYQSCFPTIPIIGAFSNIDREKRAN
jgi:hypothetical protein